MYRLKIILIVLVVSLLVGCEKKSEKISGHEVKLIKVSNDVNLELLDWGGDGPAMLFLTGLGNTAHIYDDFAPRFTDKYHVYGLTRRGFGASSQPKSGYDLMTLSADIIAVIDKLNLKKVILVGHSIAGEEMTKIAVVYPDRIEKIIYLDAAYDRTGLDKMFALMPEFPMPTAIDSASVAGVKKFMAKTTGINYPDEELQQTMVFSKEGKYLKNVTPDSIGGALHRIIVKPNYTNIKCPSLAIYAEYNSVKDVIPFYETLDSINKNKSDQLFEFFRKFEVESSEQFLKESKNGIVKKINGHHYIFLSNPDETEKAMRDFL